MATLEQVATPWLQHDFLGAMLSQLTFLSMEGSSTGARVMKAGIGGRPRTLDQRQLRATILFLSPIRSEQRQAHKLPAPTHLHRQGSRTLIVQRLMLVF